MTEIEQALELLNLKLRALQQADRKTEQLRLALYRELDAVLSGSSVNDPKQLSLPDLVLQARTVLAARDTEIEQLKQLVDILRNGAATTAAEKLELNFELAAVKNSLLEAY